MIKYRVTASSKLKDCLIKFFKMKEKIGTDAGLLWKTLEEMGTLEVKELKKVVKLTDKDLYAAIGWLAREGKLEFDQKDKELYLSLV